MTILISNFTLASTTLITISGLVVGCTPIQRESASGENQDAPVAAEVARAQSSSHATVASTVPVALEDDEAPPKPRNLPPDGLCDWVTSSDLIVWGTLEKLSKTTTPLSRAGTAIPPKFRKWEFADSCDTEIYPALALEIAVKDTMKGDTREHVTARIGLRQAALLRPQAFSGEGALTEGETIGVALHRIEEFDAWSLMGEPILRLDRGGKIRFHGTLATERPERTVDGIEGFTFAKLQTQVAQCAPTDAGIGRRESLVRNWGPDEKRHNKPTKYIAAWCKTDHSRKLPEGTCYADLDCPDGQMCNDCSGRCSVVSNDYCLADIDCGEHETCNHCTGVCLSKR